ncbi:hypothetical protein [Microbispora sp. NPDC049633]|uniref:hypothetical protein n=1 Tax=Microbispora sp. NPDC049633 TaxID=3154355 RepID=UPI0034274CD4
MTDTPTQYHRREVGVGKHLLVYLTFVDSPTGKIASAQRFGSRDLYQRAKIRCNGGEAE